MSKSRSAKSQASRPQASKPTERNLPLANPWLAIVVAWFLPGAGHFMLGRRGRGLFFAILVLGSLIFGLVLGGHLPWQFRGSPLFILASIGALGGGLPVLVARMLELSGELTGAGFEYGRAFIITAGLMNWMLVLDTWDIVWGKELENETEADDQEGEA